MMRSHCRPTNDYFVAALKKTMFASPLQIFASSESDAPSPSTAMAKRSAADAAEAVNVKQIVTRAIDEIDMAKFSVKQRGKKDEFPFFYASYDHSQLVVNLTATKWLRIPFAIENLFAIAEGRTGGKTETLNISVEVDADIAKVIQDLETVAKNQVLAVAPDFKWKDSVTQSGPYEPVFKAKLFLKAENDKHLSLCTVRPFGQPAIRGVAGDEAVKPLLKAHRGFRDAKAKLAVAFHNIWLMKDKDGKKTAGVTWRVTNLMADLPEATVYTYEDVFADEAFPDE